MNPMHCISEWCIGICYFHWHGLKKNSQSTETITEDSLTIRLECQRVRLSKRWVQWGCWCTTSRVWLWEHLTPSWVGWDSSYLVRAWPPNLCRHEFWGEGGMPFTMAIMQTCHPLCRGGVQIFHIPRIYVMYDGLSVLQQLDCITR